MGGLIISCTDSLIISLLNYTQVRIKVLGKEMEKLFSNNERSLTETKEFLRNIIIKHSDIIR